MEEVELDESTRREYQARWAKARALKATQPKKEDPEQKEVVQTQGEKLALEWLARKQKPGIVVPGFGEGDE